MFNSNMRCIEILLFPLSQKLKRTFNSNMRCIEKKFFVYSSQGSEFNSNMRCIEISVKTSSSGNR